MLSCKCNPKLVYVSKESFESHKCQIRKKDYRKVEENGRNRSVCWPSRQVLHNAFMHMARSFSGLFWGDLGQCSKEVRSAELSP